MKREKLFSFFKNGVELITHDKNHCANNLFKPEYQLAGFF